jgi:hypothetical protein
MLKGNGTVRPEKAVEFMTAIKVAAFAKKWLYSCRVLPAFSSKQLQIYLIVP